MNIKSLLTEMIITFIVALIVVALVTFLWNTLRYGTTIVDWDTAFVSAITFSIVLPLAHGMERKKE
jgi:hypothetical protein